MQDKILSLLGLAAKAGKTASGGFSAEEAVKSRKAHLLILADDAQHNTVKKFTDKCRSHNVPLRFYGSREELGRAVGKESRACVAVTDRGFAQSLLKKLQDAGRETGGGGTDCAAGQPGSGAISDEMQKRGSPAREKPPEKKDGTHIVPEDPLKGTGP